MIATILPSSPTFHAVAYNEKKVKEGSASLLELKNFGDIDTLGYSDADDLTRYLIDYSARNSRIKQPQFHLAISCKGNEYTPQQLVEFAHNYLKEMGYGDPQQPLLIYEHHDTDNTHIHVITSRVDPRGKKIKDSNERRRSQKVIEKLMTKNMKNEAAKDLQTALQFDFRTVNQFKAVLEAMNYECFEKDGQIKIKKGGMVQTAVGLEEVRNKMDRNITMHRNDPAENARLRAIFRKYRDTNSSRPELERDLKKIFGISLVCFGKKDSPYGYVAVDFSKKKVHEGAKILGIKELFDFKSPEEHISEIEDYIDNALLQNPGLTTKQLNKKLGRFGAFVRKDVIICGNRRQPLADIHAAILERNNKVDWRQGFNPQSEAERDLLCKLTGFGYPSLISVRPDNGRYYCKDFKELSDILNISDTKDKKDAFETAGFKLVKDEDGNCYAYRPGTQTLVDLNRSGFRHSQYADLDANPHPHQKKGNHHKGVNLDRKFNSEGAHYANREWEVGRKEQDPDDMDRKNGLSV